MKKKDRITKLRVLPDVPPVETATAPSPPPAETPAAPAPPTNIISINELVEKDRQTRVARAAKAIDETCKDERVVLVVSSFNFVDGRLFPNFSVRPTEPANG